MYILLLHFSISYYDYLVLLFMGWARALARSHPMGTAVARRAPRWRALAHCDAYSSPPPGPAEGPRPDGVMLKGDKPKYVRMGCSD